MSRYQSSPADASTAPPVAERKRVPMSVPLPKLSVQDIPGYHLHWFSGDPARIERALRGGYEFVQPEEVALNNRTLGSDALGEANTDMGTRVSMVAGGNSEDGQANRLYLMKIKEEWWKEDQAALESEGSRLESVRKGLLGGLLGTENQSASDKQQIYLDAKRTRIPEFLKKRT